MQVFDKVIQLKPDLAGAYINRGMALTELEQLEAAVASYDQAIELQPDLADAYSNLLFNLQYKTDFNSKFYLPQTQKFRFNCRPQRTMPPQLTPTRKTRPSLRLAWSPPTLATIPAAISLSVP